MRRSSLLGLSFFLALGACDGSAAPTDAAISDAATPNDTGSAADSAVVDSGSVDSGSVADSGSAETTYMLQTGYCFTFATATSQDSMSMDCGDMLALSGANVDLTSSDSGFCPLPGTFTSVSAIPTDYASCAWESYVEGLDPLADHGYIVRDAAHVHHYRMHIVSNAQPALVFAFDAID